MRSPFGITALLLTITLAASKWSDRRRPPPPIRPLQSIESQIEGWTAGPDQVLPETVLRQLKPTSYLQRVYHRGDRRIELFIAYYAQQRAGESMHSPKNCLPGSGWEVWDAATVDVPVGGRSVRLNKYTVYNGSRRLIVIYWYHSSNRIIASEYWGKICLVFDAISGNHTGGSIVRLALSDQPGALEDGMAFASALIPQIEKRLRP